MTEILNSNNCYYFFPHRTTKLIFLNEFAFVMPVNCPIPLKVCPICPLQLIGAVSINARDSIWVGEARPVVISTTVPCKLQNSTLKLTFKEGDKNMNHIPFRICIAESSSAVDIFARNPPLAWQSSVAAVYDFAEETNLTLTPFNFI